MPIQNENNVSISINFVLEKHKVLLTLERVFPSLGSPPKEPAALSITLIGTKKTLADAQECVSILNPLIKETTAEIKPKVTSHDYYDEYSIDVSGKNATRILIEKLAPYAKKMDGDDEPNVYNKLLQKLDAFSPETDKKQDKKLSIASLIGSSKSPSSSGENLQKEIQKKKLEFKAKYAPPEPFTPSESQKETLERDLQMLDDLAKALSLTDSSNEDQIKQVALLKTSVNLCENYVHAKLLGAYKEISTMDFMGFIDSKHYISINLQLLTSIAALMFKNGIHDISKENLNDIIKSISPTKTAMEKLIANNPFLIKDGDKYKIDSALLDYFTSLALLSFKPSSEPL